MCGGNAKITNTHDAASREAADRDHFDRIARTYARKDREKSSRIARRDLVLRALRPLLARSGGLGTVVDIGCGIGAHARYLAPRYDRYIGVDQSAELIEAGRDYNARLDGVEFIVSNIKSPDLPRHVADTVLVVGALHHMTELDKVMQSLCRLAKPGAALVAVEPQNANPIIRLMRRLRMSLDTSYSRDQIFFGEDELRGLLRRGGLEDISIEYQGFVSPPFAQVALSPQLIFAPLGALALLIERALDVILRGPLRKLSWNMVAYGRFPDESEGS